MSTLTTVNEVAGQAFDYIIIGGGTAGLVVAARLSEDPSKKVLVVEAGSAHLDDPEIYLPASYGRFFGKKDYDWGFTTVSQSHAENTTFYWARGKGLGGSSGANFYMWTRPAKVDVDAWERLGNPGWDWDNFLKYLIKCETFIPPSEEETVNERLTYDLSVHGTEGPVVVAFPNMRPGYEPMLQDTLVKFGIPRLVEPQGGDRLGTGMDVATVDPRTNKRVTSVAYLEQAGARPNLKVLVNATVCRILSHAERSEFVASGVEFLVDGEKHMVHTTTDGEVILSAGTIKSPQILELSGIGDPAVLNTLGIETKVDLPAVGTNVQDHLYCGMTYELKSPEKYNTIDPLFDPAVAAEHLKLHAEGRGLFTLGSTGVTIVPLSSMSDKAAAIQALVPSHRDVPGLAEQYTEQMACIEGGASAELTTIPGFYSFPNPPMPVGKHITFASMLNRPFSRGTIHASSSDPLSAPTIDPHYFEEEIDLLTYIEQVKFVRKLVNTDPIRSILGREINPGVEVQSDEEIGIWLKKYLTTVHHTSSSCSMLPRDKGGVVDPELRVYGTKGLRVVDLSVVPLIPGVHTQSVVYGIAEQASDLIKGVLSVGRR